ncbi:MULTISPECIES: DUF317 domain-containing protein [Streptomyces]|uniref:DUF317 domain-containing protein n=1 Tax=Streptomyces TaxID=1883 RepID=UPI00163BAF94|nr:MULTISPECIES: DUF317 domain-containing protein [Streptomyces]MBC2878090.1 DUF317 domain-containing protein [Streptomyces sp. TYQ1024]UBI40038.1 DUF317 domain-containing protein [Streptomyces mobaraensis]UKW32618.1 DUF317 domain-containing protein [Streptomyces sp. TYQ1024]
MSTDPFTHLAPDQQVQVLPRHLAGPGAADLRTVWPFPEDWSLHQADGGAALATSPCLRLFTGMVPDPDSSRRGKWTVTANRAPFGAGAWQITFDATTPVELLQDFHAELLDLYLEGRHSDRDPLLDDDTAPHEAYALLLACGWNHEIKTDGRQFFRDPDPLGVLQHRYAITSTNAPTWTAWGGYPGEPHWRAQFSHGTPTALVAAFTTSLVSTEPVTRAMKDVPLQTRRHVHIAVTTPAKQLATSSPVATPPALPGPSRTR